MQVLIVLLLTFMVLAVMFYIYMRVNFEKLYLQSMQKKAWDNDNYLRGHQQIAFKKTERPNTNNDISL